MINEMAQVLKYKSHKLILKAGRKKFLCKKIKKVRPKYDKYISQLHIRVRGGLVQRSDTLKLVRLV